MKVLSRRKRKKAWVLNHIRKRRRSGALHFTLIDPDKQKPEQAAQVALAAQKAGTDAIMIGGSQAAQAMYVQDTIMAIKEAAADLPVILFPSSHAGISSLADAVFFMSLLNSRSPQYLIEEQMKGSVMISRYKLEPLSMGYIIVESGTTTSAAWVGDVRPIPRDKPEFAVAYALAAKYFGMRFVYLEAGSGAPNPVPNEMVAAVRKATQNGGNNHTFVIVGGGIRDERTARDRVRAGADVIVTGNIAETDPEKFARIVRAVKKG
jgi:phosphoglycerol geranylgeranyltransferase